MRERRDVPLMLITVHRREIFGAKLESICQTIVQLATHFPYVHCVYQVDLNPTVRATVAKILGAGAGSRSTAQMFI